MTKLFANAVCKALTTLVSCFVVLAAPVSAAFDCRKAAVPATCQCCKNPQAGCCAAKQQGSEKPVPVAPAKTINLRDVAPVPVTVVAVLPPFVPSEFPNTWSDAADCAPHVARHSFLCIRTV